VTIPPHQMEWLYCLGLDAVALLIQITSITGRWSLCEPYILGYNIIHSCIKYQHYSVPCIPIVFVTKEQWLL